MTLNTIPLLFLVKHTELVLVRSHFVFYVSLCVVKFDDHVFGTNVLGLNLVFYKVCQVASILKVEDRKLLESSFSVFQDLGDEEATKRELILLLLDGLCASIVTVLEVAEMEDVE
jgi:hypothetical protein